MNHVPLSLQESVKRLNRCLDFTERHWIFFMPAMLGQPFYAHAGQKPERDDKITIARLYFNQKIGAHRQADHRNAEERRPVFPSVSPQ